MKNQIRWFLFVFTFTYFHFPLFSQNVGIATTTPVARLDIRGIATSPSIPGALSTGTIRIGVGANDAIDIGKMGSTPFAGWVQSGYSGFAEPLSLQPLGGNVGIGITDPGAKLHVVGTLQVSDGSQGAGKILTSDANGLASWQPPPTPPPPPTPTYYQSVGICCQSWMTKNLDVTTYRNGDSIPQVSDGPTWYSLTTGAYCYYNNDPTNNAVYGKLYNWYAVNDPRGLAPEGWQIPTDFEWTTLTSCLGGDAIAGGPMKEIGLTHWTAPNAGATNFSGFTGLPGGIRWNTGAFNYIGLFGYWWSSSEENANNAWERNLKASFEDVDKFSDSKRFGFSVRCLRD